MSPVDPTPLCDLDGLDLANELRRRMAEPQVLGVRVRIAQLAAELDCRATGVAA